MDETERTSLGEGRGNKRGIGGNCKGKMDNFEFYGHFLFFALI